MENKVAVRKKNSAEIIRRWGSIYSLKDLKGNLVHLAESEQRIIEARTTATALKDLTEEQFDASLTGIIFNISVICGCQLPTHEAHVNALEKEFCIFLRDNGYADFTANEILLAFRLNANFELPEKVESYGAVFNIDFAGKVMRQYDVKRERLDEKVLDHFTNKEREAKLEAEAQARREKAKEQFIKFLSDEKAELDLTNCFMQLADDGAFANRKDFWSFVDAEERGQTEITGAMEKIFSKMDMEFDAQKAAVKFLFENMKKSGRDVLYDAEWRLAHPNFELPKKLPVAEK